MSEHIESESNLIARSEQVNITSRDIQRFWLKVLKAGTDDCWIWQGGQFSHAYGHFFINGGDFQSHRFSWMLANGTIPKDMCVCHNCPNGDNPLCVNPAHLWLGTSQQNTADRDAKGRTATGIRSGPYTKPEKHPRGVNNGLAKLDDEKIRDIRERWKRGETYKNIGNLYSVTVQCIYAIIKGKTWVHVK